VISALAPHMKNFEHKESTVNPRGTHHDFDEQKTHQKEDHLSKMNLMGGNGRSIISFLSHQI
jgi:hypothetical protein